MKKRSKYTYTIICDKNKVEKLIQEYLKANEFKLIIKNKESYYKAGDASFGYVGFKYVFNDEELEIYAWVFSIFGGEYPFINKAPLAYNPYADSMLKLLKDIEKINQGGDNIE